MRSSLVKRATESRSLCGMKMPNGSRCIGRSAQGVKNLRYFPCQLFRRVGVSVLLVEHFTGLFHDGAREDARLERFHLLRDESRSEEHTSELQSQFHLV